MRWDIVLIVLLVVVPAVLQMMAISVYTDRLARAIRRSADKPPFTTLVEIREVGPQPRAVARLLDRATRLDTDEIDALIGRRAGALPLPMSRPVALRLATELQQLGASVETRFCEPQ